MTPKKMTSNVLYLNNKIRSFQNNPIIEVSEDATYNEFIKIPKYIKKNYEPKNSYEA